jgi:hypothetical protein
MEPREESMPRTSMARVGGICSILAGAVFLCSGVAFFFLAGRFDYNSIESISTCFASVPAAGTLLTIVNMGAALASFLAIAGVLALTDLMRRDHEGLIRWASTLAIIGYSVLAISDIADLYRMKRLALGYPQLASSAKLALEVIGVGSLDPTLVLRYITIGPWFLVAGWVAFRSGRLPRPLAVSGVVAGMAALLFVVVTLLELQALTMAAVVITLVFHPLWLIWTGIELGRAGA